MARRKRNVIAQMFIGLFLALAWIGKAIWYVIKGITLAAWWLVKKIAESIERLGKRKQAKHVLEDAAKETPAPAKTERGGQKHKPESTPLEAVETAAGDFGRFDSRLNETSMIVLIAGKRGSGKSALGFRILENAHATSERPAYALGVKASVLPSWISSVDDVEQVSNQGMVLVDEGALSFSSRESMSKKNKELGKLLAIARHKDLTLLLVTQNTGMIDKNVLNLCDTVILKEGSLLQQKMERDAMKELYSKAGKAIKALPSEDRTAHAYIVSDDFEGLVRVALPSFWSSKVSKSRA